MAIVPLSIQELPQTGGYIGVRIWKWESLTQSDSEGAALPQPNFTDRAVQVEGTFDGATVTLKGSIDGANFHTLTDPQANPLSFTSGGIKQISEAVRVLKPELSGGTASDLTVTILMKGN